MAHTLITKYRKGNLSHKHPKVEVRSFLNTAKYDWDYSLSVQENHAVAAGHYLYELNKERTGDRQWAIIGGGLMPDDDGYAFIIDLK